MVSLPQRHSKININVRAPNNRAAISETKTERKNRIE